MSVRSDGVATINGVHMSGELQELLLRAMQRVTVYLVNMRGSHVGDKEDRVYLLDRKGKVIGRIDNVG